MGLADYMSENMSNNGQQSWRQWEPDHEPPMDGKPDVPDVSCVGNVEPRPAPASQPLSNGVPSSALAPLNHHNQLTRFIAKQTLGYIPKLSVRSPERSTSPPSAVYGGMPREGGVFNFESPRASAVRSPSFRLPSIGTPPLSPQKWASPSPFANQEDAESGRPSLPALNQSAGSFIQRSGSFSESCSSPIPPLKRAHQETTRHAMSIADLCQPFRYVRSSSCPSDTNPGASGSNPATPPQESVPQPAVEQSWRPAIEQQTYIRTQSCSSDADMLRGSLPHSSDEFQHNRLERSSSMDAPTLMRHLKRTAAESIDLTQWLDRPCRNSLSSLADSADSMHQLEQAGRSMRISDSPRADLAPNETKREKKLCAFPQCSSNAVTRGLCISHGGGRRCQRKGCTRGAQSKGLCVAHGGGRICRAAGCSNIQRSMGLCIRHGGGRRCSVKGCQKGVVRQDLCTAHGGKRKCRVPECTKHVKKKGLCRSHANSMYVTSSLQ
ncbi:hypothetical protein F441_09710 [Phytophthora nicotianae CJ01A1]|uniref:WRKY19-like zinc finger domain-containing protein n=3 Tax=Phytophthora nicotianae TaxID=4792 RepID=W2ZBR3_PHYNI|nr:hypothetical protein L915_09576 [Phytophthora nicotianae]ETL39131.1 hypothetical protein L916_09477 [Phytophthora nicotianae]ETM45549.1 hypothetical protein L914_09445 [Phytophthora nicotianae]ETP15576.1 hypothetical protein F441_09710 [Phytophthora nicotianae CJ01A1]ETP43639.1 hypothetical protein F442_09675 [Phytophthora nicotianae P10297]